MNYSKEIGTHLANLIAEMIELDEDTLHEDNFITEDEPHTLAHIKPEQKLPDNDQWQHRFEIKSASSGRKYIVAQNKSKRHWGCSCPGWRSHRTCKHLQALGLPAHERPHEFAAKKEAKEMHGSTLSEDAPKALKTINSHVGYSRHLDELGEPIGYTARHPDVPSPYASSPTDIVHKWNGKNVFTRETSHKRYQTFEVPKESKIHKNEEDAEQEHLKNLRARRN